jgi:hypothetical protein
MATTKITLNEIRSIVKQIIKEKKSYQKQLFNIGDSIIVNNLQNLPKGYKNIKKGDKIVVTKIWRNANDNTILYAFNNSDYGMDNEDVLSIK